MMHLGITLSTSPGLAAGPDFGQLAGFAQKAEQAGLDMIVFADPPPPIDAAKAPRASAFEPTTLVSALAAVTQTIGLVAAASTLAHQPYNLARRFASLDIVSHGRTGWLATLAPGAAEVADFSRLSTLPAADIRSRSQEFVRIVKGLWQGWDADALLFDKAAGRFFDPAKMHVLDHQGDHFSVRGPLNVARSAQDTPVLIMTDVPEVDMDFAAGMADVVLPGTVSLERAGRFRNGLRQRAAALGRDPATIKVLAGVAVFVGATAAEARKLRDASRSAHAQLASATGLTELVGTPVEIADALEQGYTAEACDGFDVVGPSPALPSGDFVDLVVPELRRRGLIRAGNSETTLRSRLDLGGEQVR